MLPPEGTFLAPVRQGMIQLPPPIHRYCLSEGWTLFRFEVTAADYVTIRPVLKDDTGAFHASLGADGKLWIPAELRTSLALGEQSVMLRIEDAAVRMYIRKVFEALGFRP